MVKFILNNNKIETEKLTGSLLLDFVRYDKTLTGTKIGCREGDCGACTVLIGDLIDGQMNYKQVTSCLTPLGNVQGKHVVTIEGLNMEDLSPVQKCMVNESGTQCGFCTVGFVVSLTGFCLSNSEPSYKDAIAAIDGNICRCTGYKGIVQACKSLNNKKRLDHFSKNKKNTIKLLQKINNESLVIYNKGKRFFAPKYVTELKKILKKNKDAKLIGGQTDVGLTVTQEKKDFDNMIYLSSISELNYIKANKEYIEVGSQTSLTDFEFFIEKYYPDFSRMLKRYGSVGIRNVGTLSGNIQTCSPIGDSLPPLLALGAKVVIKGIKKTKIVPLNNFIVGYRTTKLKKQQFISAILIPIHKGILKIYKIIHLFQF